MPALTRSRADAREQYRHLSAADLESERLRVMDALDSDNPSEDDQRNADALTAELTARSLADDLRESLGGLSAARTSGSRTAGRSASALGRMLATYEARGGAGRLADELETRAVITLPPNAPTTFIGMESTPEQPTTFLDLLRVLTTPTGSVEYLVASEGTNAADVVPEGAAKPEGAFSFTMGEAKTETIAEWVAITRQFLEDLPQAETWVQARLTAQIRAKLEALAYAAITATAGITTAGGASLIETVVRLQAALTAKGYRPTAFAVNPADVVTQTLATTDNGSWLGTPSGLVLPILVPSAAVAAGKVVGVDPTAAALLVRGQTRTLVFDQHADLALKNTLVVLAETRAAAAVFMPGGVGVGTITPAP